MQGYNLIVVFSPDGRKVLMCKRRKDPYYGKFNFVGGKIEPNEDGYDAAYRELYEETGITYDDIRLVRLMDFKYYFDPCYVEVWFGKLDSDIGVSGAENDLFWSDTDMDFFSDEYAGEGNIGHIMIHCLNNMDLLDDVCTYQYTDPQNPAPKDEQ